MATAPDFLSRQTMAGMPTTTERPAGPQLERDPFQLRALPFEDVYFRPGIPK